MPERADKMMTALAIPGFVDLQVNGFIGVDFSSETLTEESFSSACRAMIGKGTAAFLPTLITSPEPLLKRNISVMLSALKKDPQLNRHILGLHLEGPFVSKEPGAVGAHDPSAVAAPDIALFDRLYHASEGRLRLLTIAAETVGAAQLAAHAVTCGTAVSCGHQMAGADDLAALASAGATALTHLGNGMPNMVHRHNNPLLAGLAEERLQIMFIPDGHHLPQHVLRLFARAAGAGRLIATSDTSPIAGLPPGTYTTLGNKAVLEPDGLLHNPDKQCLVGSSATMLICMNVLHGLGLFTLEELLRIGFYNPLALIKAAPSDVPPSGYTLDFSPERGFTVILKGDAADA